MAWIGLNARLLAVGAGSFCRRVCVRNGRVFLRTFDGMLVSYDFTRRDGGLHPMYVYDFVYERAELDVIRQWFRADSTFIDIGANIGLHSIRSDDGTLPGRFVLAIEADQRTYRSLEANVSANDKTASIRTRRSILWSSVTKIRWHGGELEHGHNHASLADAAETVTATTETLDDLVREAGPIAPISIIKLDVEGAELAVLKGGERTLRSHKPALVVEIDDKLLAPNGTSGDELRAYLHSLGYSREIPIVNSRSGAKNNSLFIY